VVKAGSVAKKELAAISKQIDALKRQLLKTSKRMQKALS
jgi:ribosome-associated translation inhibitor RaiA